MAIASLVTIVLSVLTGERINFLIRACGGMLAGLVGRPKFGLVILILIELGAVAVCCLRGWPSITFRPSWRPS